MDEKAVLATDEDIRTVLSKVTHEFNLDSLEASNFIAKIQPLLDSNQYKIRREDGKIEPLIEAGAHYDVPWMYVRPDVSKNCNLWHKVMFNVIGIFPPECLKCWKVVVKPETVKQLFQLLILQEHVWTGFCKCGIEERSYTHGNYGGYFYNSSKEEGQQCLIEVREMVHKYIDSDIPVYLKRYCTEFELKFGPSDEIENNLARGFYVKTNPDGSQKKVYIPDEKESRKWAVFAERWFDCEKDKYSQPGLIKLFVLSRWMQFAYDRGDKTVLEFNPTGPGGHFYTPPVRYEEAPVIKVEAGKESLDE